MSSTSLLRLPQVTKRRARGRSQLYNDIQRGLMTPPVRVSPQVSAWPEHEIDALNRAEISGMSIEERKILVQQLIAHRAQMRPEIGAAFNGV